MKVAFSNTFEKQLDQVTNSKLRNQIREAVKWIMEADNLVQVPTIKKLKGYANAYRIRSGNYRIGLTRGENGVITVEAFDHQKDFYKRFP